MFGKPGNAGYPPPAPTPPTTTTAAATTVTYFTHVCMRANIQDVIQTIK